MPDNEAVIPAPVQADDKKHWSIDFLTGWKLLVTTLVPTLALVGWLGATYFVTHEALTKARIQDLYTQRQLIEIEKGYATDADRVKLDSKIAVLTSEIGKLENK